VIQAVTERDATESIGALIDQVREKVFPILDDAGRSVKTLADVMERLQKGEGDVGRLLTDDTMVRDIEGIVAKAGGAVSDLAEVASELQLAARNIKTLSQSINARDNGVPRLLQRADTTLATLQQSMRDLALAAQRAPPDRSQCRIGLAGYTEPPHANKGFWSPRSPLVDHRRYGQRNFGASWAESGGPAVQVPTRRGFGTTLIERTLTHELDAEVRREFGSLVCAVRWRFR